MVSLTVFQTGRRRALGGLERQNAQSLVEFGLVIPIFIIIMMVALQLSFLFMAQLVVIWVATDNVRHAATATTGIGDNWMLPDSCQTTYRNSNLPPWMLTSNITTFTFSPAYNPATSSCTSVAGNSPAATATPTPNRQRGGNLTLTMRYNPSNLKFLPSSFFGVPILATLPSYSVSRMME